MITMKQYKTPLRYPGGKSRACKKMEPFFPDLRDYDVYYEPFLGGGSVALHIPFPIFLSYIAAYSEIYGSWLLIIGLLTRLGALAIVGTISVAIYHAVVTAGFNIYLLELLILYFGGAFCVLCYGGGDFALDRFLRKFRIKFNRPHLPFE